MREAADTSNSCCSFTFGVISLTVLILTLIYWKNVRLSRGTRKPSKASHSVLAVLGSGGHTKEMLILLSALSKKFSPRYYVIASTDSISEQKIHQFEVGKVDYNKDNLTYSVHKIPRSREVKQSWLTTVLTTLHAMMSCLPIVFKLRPDVILCNGPGTCIPICCAGILLKILTTHRIKIVYVESICRVQTLSLSAKLLYYVHVADEIVVQWESLQRKYPRTAYIGRIV